MVHEIFFTQRKAFDDGLRLFDAPRIKQEDDSAPIATRIPFPNFPIEIELHGRADFSWHDSHHLLVCDARLHGQDDDHAGGGR